MKTIIFFAITFLWILKISAGTAKGLQQFERLNQGNKHFADKKYELAEAEFKNIIISDPKNSLAYFNLALTKYRQGDYGEAIKNFDIVSKMPSYYKGAAFYYKSIAQLNLGQTEDAVRTVKQYTHANFFYKPLQSLMQAIETGSDEHFENARQAAADGNYELCLLEINQSVLTDTPRGRELITKCIVELKRGFPSDSPPDKTAGDYYKLYLDTIISQSDNVFQKNSSPINKMFYLAEVGGEYLFKNKVDIGFGFNYSHVNAIDQERFKAENYNFHIPIYYRAAADYYGATPFFEQNKNADQNSYSDVGVSLFYSHLAKNNYRLGLQGSSAKRTALANNFDYKVGTVNSVRVFATSFINDLSITGSAAFDQNLAGDISMGPFMLPYANEVKTYGVEISYDFDKVSVLRFKYNVADKDYLHIVSPNNTDRRDKLTRTSLTYHYVFSKNLKAFLQRSFIKNDSNYGENEFINKNYSENVTSAGLSLITY